MNIRDLIGDPTVPYSVTLGRIRLDFDRGVCREASPEQIRVVTATPTRCQRFELFEDAPRRRRRLEAEPSHSIEAPTAAEPTTEPTAATPDEGPAE